MALSARCNSRTAWKDLTPKPPPFEVLFKNKGNTKRNAKIAELV